MAKGDINILLNMTYILMQCLRYHQIYIYAHTVLAYLKDFPTYMNKSPHTQWIMCPTYPLQKNSEPCTDTSKHN